MKLFRGLQKVSSQRNGTHATRENSEQLKYRLAEVERENADLRREVMKLKAENEGLTAMVVRMLPVKAR